MFKGVIGNPPKAIVLGLSMLNLDRLEQNDPIVVFGDEDLDLDFDIMIQAGAAEPGWIPDEVKVRDRKVCVLGLRGDVLKTLRHAPGRALVTIHYNENIDILIISGQDEAAMATQFQDMIGPETRGKTSKRLLN